LRKGYHAKGQKIKIRCYTWGGEGWQKRAERSGFALNCEALIETIKKHYWRNNFLFLFASRQKENQQTHNKTTTWKM